MSDIPDPSPFELEPDDEEGAPRKPLPSLGRAAPGGDVPDEPEVDDRTLAERKGEVRPRGAVEQAPPPAGWPGEMFSFPFRRPGPAFFTLGWFLLTTLDMLGTLDALRFPGWVFKLFVMMYLLRASFHVIGTSAAGRDQPHGWSEALQFDREDMWRYFRTLSMFAGLLLPGTLLWIFDKFTPGILLLLMGSMYATIIAMGAALRDPSLKYPWHALRWIATRPLHCLFGSAGWWVLLGTELALHGLQDGGLLVYGFVALILRAAGMYVLLVSARIVGVMGRAWTAT